ncbi:MULTISPECIES: hypothetical protein [Xanthomonas]|uniref:hypothetical protein n=1 Tax=Xanthomonas TaxID=338 RepID=UPI000E1F4010|nr:MULTISPECIES: hypothetical protein [Xanthomonas]
MMRRIASALFGLLALIGTAQATEQIPDHIQLDGQQALLLAEPLSGQLDDPTTWKRFVAQAGSSLGGCSANWRGYQAFWRVDAEQLVLDRVVLGACAEAPPELPLSVLFPGQRAPVPAVWVDGELIAALPAAENATSDAPASYVSLRLRRGRVVAREPLTADMLRARQAAAARPVPVP